MNTKKGSLVYPEDGSPEAIKKLLLINEKAKCCQVKPGSRIVLNPREKHLLSLRWPVQKIIGHTHFDSLKIPLDRDVFIPRLETYELLLHACNTVDGFLKRGYKEIKILDLCSGTGVLGLSLKKRFQSLVDVTLIDISEDAIRTSEDIATSETLVVNILKGDLFNPLDVKERFDLVVSNPPYLLEEQLIGLDFEPRIALYGGEDGLSFYRRILRDVPNFLSDNSVIIFEISPETSGFFRKKRWEVIKDINGKDRFARFKFIGERF